MNTIYDIISRAEQLRAETAIGSVTPNRVGAILYDTLAYLNEAQVFADSLIHKVYASEEDFLADSEHISDLTGRPMKAGQLIYVYGPDALYRYDGGNAKTLLKEHALDAIPQLNELREALISLNDAKANTTGYYPQMGVGFADDLVGRGESVPAEFSFRASGGKSIKDGAARVKRLKGNSVVWNQKFDAAQRLSPTPAGITYTQDGFVFMANGTANSTSISHNGVNIKLDASHKYIVPVKTSDDVYVQVYDVSNAVIYNSIFTAAHSANAIIRLRVAAGTTLTNYKFTLYLIDLTQMFGAGNEPTTIKEFNARKPIVEDEYAYNEGEVIHMTAEGIKSVGDNAWDEQWESGMIDIYTGNNINSAEHCRTVGYIEVIPNEQYYISFPAATATSSLVVICYDANKAFIQHIGGGSANKKSIIPANCHYIRFIWVGTEYNNNIMLTLVHSGWKQDTDAGYQPYWEDRLMFDQRIKDEFPNGLQKWDMVYNKDGKGYIVKGTGVVDMGELAWYKTWYNEDGLWRIYAEVPQKAKGLSNLINRTYPNSGVGNSMMANNTITGNVVNAYIYIKDSSYSLQGVDALIASIHGVPLYYQLAEPTIIEYDESFNLDYRVADFGTEQAIAEQPSAPISADIIYQFNAVDMIREHEIEIAELQSIITEQQSVIATMQVQLDSLISKNEEIK